MPDGTGLDIDGVGGDEIAKILDRISHQPHELMDELKRKLTQD